MMLASKRKQPQIPMPLADLRSAPGHGNAVLLGSVAPVPSSGALRGRPSNGQNDLHERARIGVTHSKFSTKFFGTLSHASERLRHLQGAVVPSVDHVRLHISCAEYTSRQLEGCAQH
jgi:hypothetical protein